MKKILISLVAFVAFSCSTTGNVAYDACETAEKICATAKALCSVVVPLQKVALQKQLDSLSVVMKKQLP